MININAFLSNSQINIIMSGIPFRIPEKILFWLKKTNLKSKQISFVFQTEIFVKRTTFLRYKEM